MFLQIIFLFSPFIPKEEAASSGVQGGGGVSPHLHKGHAMKGGTCSDNILIQGSDAECQALTPFPSLSVQS